jgi:hypothetical protein
MSTLVASNRGTPWHVWVVATLTLLWNGAGAYTTLMAQAGKLPDAGAEEAAYYAAQPLWSVIATDIALFAPLAAAVALLLRSRTAAWLFAVSLAAVVLTNVYDLVAGTSLALVDRGWAVVTSIIVMLAVLQLVYSLAMKRRAVLA